MRTPLLLLLAAVLAVAGSARAAVYQTPEAFLDEAFAGGPPAPRVIWLSGDTKAAVRGILGHDYPSLRIRYWAEDGRSAWILDEIGKERPITTGLVVDHGHIERVRILEYRESRGWEVRHDFFTGQFKGAGLDEDRALDRPIDNITGATLSVRAVKRLARLALYLAGRIPTPADPR